MRIIYKSIDGKQFNDKDICVKHENKLSLIKKTFDDLVDQNFFPNYNIRPFFHNREITTLENPKKSDWKPQYRGYVLMHGRMGNGDTIITFKIRGNKLLIFRYDTDDAEKKIYMGSIPINQRLEKLKRIKNIINTKTN
jgi:hypothetical protein